ncbi:hypothetical protein CFP56_038019 [Quercus suber]|uniref:Uncharacterized protein n=1 Tax=Quercus suber TaxID=58331 RepID=A0AAW0LQS3_QUESU
MDLCLNSNPPTEWKKVVDSGLNKRKWSSLQAVISKLTWGATIQSAIFGFKETKLSKVNKSILPLTPTLGAFLSRTILTSDKSSKSSPLNPPSRIICHVPEAIFTIYMPLLQFTILLPPVLQVALEKIEKKKKKGLSHSFRCTESFMQENVAEELQQMRPNDETKWIMLDILKRFPSENEAWMSMSVEEKERFQRAPAFGELSKMIEPWEPWWLNPAARTIALIKEEINLSNHLPNKNNHEIPLGPESPLLPVSKLSSTEPSPPLAVHLLLFYSLSLQWRLAIRCRRISLGGVECVLSLESR